MYCSVFITFLFSPTPLNSSIMSLCPCPIHHRIHPSPSVSLFSYFSLPIYPFPSLLHHTSAIFLLKFFSFRQAPSSHIPPFPFTTYLLSYIILLQSFSSNSSLSVSPLLLIFLPSHLPFTFYLLHPTFATFLLKFFPFHQPPSSHIHPFPFTLYLLSPTSYFCYLSPQILLQW
jgi:hypothetical protein